MNTFPQWLLMISVMWMFIGLMLAMIFWPKFHIEDMAKSFGISIKRAEGLGVISMLIVWPVAVFLLFSNRRYRRRKDREKRDDPHG